MKPQMPGHGLRSIREQLGLTLKDVESQSRRISEIRHNQEYLFTAGRLSQVENSFSLPSLYKLAALSEIYEKPYDDLLRLYGIDTAKRDLTADSDGKGSGTASHEDEREQRSPLEPSPVWV